jgi:hypothetical protein
VKRLKNGSIDIFNLSYRELIRGVEGDGVCVIHTMKVEKHVVVGDNAKCPFGFQS